MCDSCAAAMGLGVSACFPAAVKPQGALNYPCGLSRLVLEERLDETAARQVLLVRAAETGDAADALLTEDDRGYAARAAAELVRWRADR